MDIKNQKWYIHANCFKSKMADLCFLTDSTAYEDDDV